MKREAIERLPTAVRDDIKKHLAECIKRAEATKIQAANAYVITTDEVQRSTALIAQGELDAFTVLYNIFK